MVLTTELPMFWLAAASSEKIREHEATTPLEGNSFAYEL